jgi:protease-4
MSARRGALVLVILLTGLGLILMVAAVSLRLPDRQTPSSTVLSLDVPSTLEEDRPPAEILSTRFWRRPRPTLFELLEVIRSAADDDHVAALVLHVGDIDWGWAKVADVRDALLEFRAAGKPIYASVEGGGEAEYLIASVAPVVALPPAGELRINGLSATALFLRGTFDKLGVRPNFVHVGRFKSAVESYTRTGFSEPAREAMSAILGDTYSALVDSVAVDRALSPDSIRAWMDRGPFPAAEAMTLGLVDTLLYRPDVDSLAVRRAGRGSTILRFSRYAARFSPARVGTHIALITASGEIAPGRSRTSAMGERILGAETLIDALRKVRTRRSIRAVVLRIDSPGGDVVASDAIWREVDRLHRVKPVIVSMSDLAASGGYYIAVAADTILAQPATLTGSIGIFGGKFNVLGLYQKLGINIESVVTGPRAEMYSPFRDFRPDEEQAFARGLQNSYQRFLRLVAEGRRLPVEAVDSIAQGRVWSGKAAVTLGLVDQLGGLEDAIEVARHRAGISSTSDLVIDRFPEVEMPFFERFLSDVLRDDEPDDAGVSLVTSPLKVLAGAAARSAGRAQALMPYTLIIR